MPGTLLRALLRDRKGVALVEFALIVPILAMMVLGLYYGGALLTRTNAMHAGVSSAAQYVMRGGSDLSTAQAIGISAWPGRSDAGTLQVSRVCRCGTTVSDCSTICADQTIPNSYVQVSGADTLVLGGWSQALSTTEEIRTR